MEEKRSFISRFSGLIRFILGLVIVIIVAFLLVRFISGRQDTKNAEEASQQTSSESSKEDTSSSDTSNSDSSTSSSSDSSESSSSSSSSNENSDDVQIPSGIADTGPSTVGSVPEAGMGSSTAMIAVFAGLAAFTFTKYRQSRAQL
jgi:cytoskeletal protein RodZ